MTDTVERLCDLARVAEDVQPDFQQIQWLLDAADEIERLRGLLREAEQELEHETLLVWRIREALGDVSQPD